MPSGGGSSKTVSTQELAPEQRKLLSGVIPVARDYLKQDLKLFPNSVIPGFNPQQQQGRGMIADAATGTIAPTVNNALGSANAFTTGGGALGLGGAAGLIGAGQPAQQGLGAIINGYGDTQGARDFITSGALLNPNTNPVLGAQAEAAMRPIFTSLQESVLPGVRSDFVGNNMFGSSRQGIAEGRAIDSAVQQAGDVATGIQNNAFNQGLGALLRGTETATQAATQGIGQGLAAQSQGSNIASNMALQSLAQTPELAGLSLVPGQVVESLGASDRALRAQKLQEQSSKFTTKQMLPFMKAQDVANLAFGMGGGTATTTGSQGGRFDPFGTAMGVGQLGLLAYGLGAFSDRRLKKSIAKVFRLGRNQWYRFQYLWSSKWHLGVMADEVPHAAVRVGAFDMVNYERI